MGYINYNSLDFYKLILENIDGVIVVDRKGKIVFINHKYAYYLGIDREKILGESVKKIIPQTRLDIVLKTGKAEYADTPVVKGKQLLCNRIPLIVNGETVGAFALILTENIGENSRTLASLNQLKAGLDFYKEEVKLLRGAKYSIDHIIGDSEQMLKLKDTIRHIASIRSTVLIQGETGTGKELIAHAIHQESSRAHHPFVRFSCAAIPEELIESELFGYLEGAFTGAVKKGKPGKFETANKGSIFLDEINEMPQKMQVKLLRVIQEKEIDKLGAEYPVQIDVRIIASSSKSLESLVEKNVFREDLFYRLNVIRLYAPPLRDRKEDIPLLIDYLIQKLNQSLGLRVSGIDPESLKFLQSLRWNGNVRELENVLEGAMNDCLRGRLQMEHFSRVLPQPQKKISNSIGRLKDAISNTEVYMIKEAINVAMGNKAKAAKILGINRVTLYKKLKKYSINLP